VVKATAPTVDVVTPTNVVYRIVKARLDVNATSSIIQATPASCSLTAPAKGCMIVTLDILNPSTNKPYVAAMQNLGNGTYTITFNGLPTPNVVTIVSGNGGSATTAVTRIR
jgi:archaellum component FlaF (FlaF/FlaG flagellin family)